MRWGEEKFSSIREEVKKVHFCWKLHIWGGNPDDHAVLLVHELVHLGTYLLDGSFRLPAVDVDSYPAGAALCHRLMFWQRWSKRPSRLGTATGKRSRAG